MGEKLSHSAGQCGGLCSECLLGFSRSKRVEKHAATHPIWWKSQQAFARLDATFCLGRLQRFVQADFRKICNPKSTYQPAHRCVRTPGRGAGPFYFVRLFRLMELKRIFTRCIIMLIFFFVAIFRLHDRTAFGRNVMCLYGGFQKKKLYALIFAHFQNV